MGDQRMFLQLDRVKCLDETGGKWVERFGNDEIWLSGVAVDATGAPFELAPFEVYKHFDDGEVKKYQPPKTLFTLSVPELGRFPKICRAMLILCERANGSGHQTATRQALKNMQEAIAAAKAAGADMSVTTSSFWDVLLDKAKQWALGVILSGLKDNVFPPMHMAPMQVTSGNFFWGDGTKLSPEETLVFKAHQGTYYVTCYWQIE